MILAAILPSLSAGNRFAILSMQQARPELPLLFRTLILIFMFLLIAVSVFLLYRNRKLVHRLTTAMLDSQEQFAELDRCRIDNLPMVVDALSNSGNEQLAEAGERLQEDTDRLYQGQWLPSPESYLDADQLLTARQNTQLSFEPPLQILALGVVASVLSMLFALNFAAGARTSGLQFGLLPALLGAVAAALLSVQIYRIRRSLKHHTQSLSRSIRRRVPVFEELSGTAALIESFVRYDRDMAASIDTLTTTVNDLSKNKMVELISRNLSATLREELAPPLRDTQQSIGLLARELTEYQAEGVRQMAAAFIAELDQGMTVHLSEIMNRMDKLADRLDDHYHDLAQSQALMQEQREHSASLYAELNDTLRHLRESRDDWQEDLAQAREIQVRLNETLEQMHKLQAGETAGLHSQLTKLSQQIQRYHEAVSRVEGNLEKLNQSTNESVNTFSASSSDALKQIRDLIASMEDTASGMSGYAEVSATHLAELNSSLRESVSVFNGQIRQGVDSTLQQFDQGLGEVSHRLAETTSDLRETVDHLAVSTRKYESADNPQNRPDRRE